MPPPDPSSPAWFARVGLPLLDHERTGVVAMLDAFGFAAGAGVAGATSWWDAAQIIRAEESDSRRWDAEEEERERLWLFAAERLTEEDLLAQLAQASARWSDAVRDAAMAAAARAGVADPGLVRAAADAALLAVHHCALADLAGAAEGHYFRRKFRLFAAGRWPLGMLAGKYVVF